MKRRYWTEQEIAFLSRLYPGTPTQSVADALGRCVKAVYYKAHILGLTKTPEYLAGEASGRIQRGRQDPRLVATQFKPGQVPHNKGKPFDVARTNPAVRANQFKPGSRPHTWVPVGSYRLNPDGHLQRKIGEAPGSPHLRWRNVSELVWCAANGPLPPGHIVVFKPGRFSAELEQITEDAVECISKADNARRNSAWARLPPEVARLTQLKGAITRQVNRITRETKEKEATS